MADTKFVRLASRLSSRTIVDINSGWSISGMDVVEVPEAKKSPNAARFVRDKINRGVLEPASKAEYDEVQEAFTESQEAFNERLENLAALGVEPTRLGFAIHQEQSVQQAARARRERLDRNSEDERARAYKEDRARRASVTGQGGDDEDEDGESDYSSWSNAKLREELGERDLPTVGNKAEMVARLEEDDAEDSEDFDEEEGGNEE